MVRIASALIAASLSACLFFACGDKNAQPSPYAISGGATASGVGGASGTGGSTGGTVGAGGSTDTGSLDSGSGDLGGTTSAGGTASGSGGAAGGTTTATVTYSKTIAPLMAASCALSGCHSGSSPVLGIGLDSYANVKANATAADGAIQAGTMPTGNGAALTATDKKNFHAWVSAGAPNN